MWDFCFIPFQNHLLMPASIISQLRNLIPHISSACNAHPHHLPIWYFAAVSLRPKKRPPFQALKSTLTHLTQINPFLSLNLQPKNLTSKVRVISSWNLKPPVEHPQQQQYLQPQLTMLSNSNLISNSAMTTNVSGSLMSANEFISTCDIISSTINTVKQSIIIIAE